MSTSLETPPRPAPTAPPSGRILGLRVATAVLGGVVVLAGTAGVVGSFMIREDVDTTRFSEPLTQVRVTADTGDVTVTAGRPDQGATVVSHRTSAFRTSEHRESVRNGVLEVHDYCRGGLMIVADSCSIDFEITVPPGTAVNVKNSTGDVAVSGTRSGVTVDSGTGSIRVEGISGPVTLDSNSGDIDVRGADAAVRLTSDTGDLRAQGLTGDTVSTSSHTGDVRLAFTAAPDRVKATSNTGDLRVLVPRDGTLYRMLTDSSTQEAHIDVPTSSESPHTMSLSTDTGRIEAEARLNGEE